MGDAGTDAGSMLTGSIDVHCTLPAMRTRMGSRCADSSSAARTESNVTATIVASTRTAGSMGDTIGWASGEQTRCENLAPHKVGRGGEQHLVVVPHGPLRSARSGWPGQGVHDGRWIPRAVQRRPDRQQTQIRLDLLKVLHAKPILLVGGQIARGQQTHPDILRLTHGGRGTARVARDEILDLRPTRAPGSERPGDSVRGRVPRRRAKWWAVEACEDNSSETTLRATILHNARAIRSSHAL